MLNYKVKHLRYLSMLQLQDDTQSLSGGTDVKFQLAKDTLETMLKSMYCIREQMSNIVSLLATFSLSVCDKGCLYDTHD